MQLNRRTFVGSIALAGVALATPVVHAQGFLGLKGLAKEVTEYFNREGIEIAPFGDFSNDDVFYVSYIVRPDEAKYAKDRCMYLEPVLDLFKKTVKELGSPKCVQFGMVPHDTVPKGLPANSTLATERYGDVFIVENVSESTGDYWSTGTRYTYQWKIRAA